MIVFILHRHDPKEDNRIRQEDELLQKIEDKRNQLLSAALYEKCLTDEDIVRLSQELDIYIVKFQKQLDLQRKKCSLSYKGVAQTERMSHVLAGVNI
ncbi:aspartyl-phosphate phosphatase Spo0E family protein [Paenibacillus sp. MER TA 81-3]|nr:aspartyl-phosphate phosphatase Spo0E family protein [Paenibacillus sp. MER TA 81-3]